MLGDGEEIVLAISEVIQEWKAEDQPGGRVELLRRLAASGGVYVPAFYDVAYAEDHTIEAVVPNKPGVPDRVRKHTLMDLDAWPYPRKPLVPLAETVHERFSVEIFGGGPRGCRFCQAGMITRPVRERSITTIAAMVENGIRQSGSKRWVCFRFLAPITPRSGRSRRGWRIGTKVPTCPYPCRAPELTPSISPWRMSSRATAAAPDSHLRPKVAASDFARSSTRWSPKRT